MHRGGQEEVLKHISGIGPKQLIGAETSIPSNHAAACIFSLQGTGYSSELGVPPFCNISYRINDENR